MQYFYRFLFVIFFLYHSTSLIQATNYYVSTVGNDSNNGQTIDTPFKTIQKGADVALAGDTVYILGGTYTDGLIVIKNSGRDGAYITFTNYNNEPVIIDDTWVPERYWDTTINKPAAMINIVGKSYIKISGLNLVNQPPTVYCNHPPYSCIDGDSNKGFSPLFGIRVVSDYISSAKEQNDDWVDTIVSPADHIIIENNRVEETLSTAISVWTGSTNVIVSGNTIVNGQNDHLNGHTNSDQEVLDIVETTGFEVMNNHLSYSGRPDNHGNPFYGLPGAILLTVKGGRHLNMEVKDGKVHHNTITNNPYQGGIYIDAEKTSISNIDINDNYFFYSNGISIGAECGGPVSDIRVFNNVLNYTGKSAIMIVTSNTCYDPIFLQLHPTPLGNGIKRNISIFNNTIFGTFKDGGRGIWITSAGIQNITIKNNIVAFVPVSQTDINNSYHAPAGYTPYYALYTGQISRLTIDPTGAAVPASEIHSSNNIIVDRTVYPVISQLSFCDTCSEAAISGTIVADPQFIASTFGANTKADLPVTYTQTTSDLHLRATSGAIDTGTMTITDMISAPSLDHDLGIRPYGTGVDIGAYEFGSSPSPTPSSTPVPKPGDANNDGKVDGVDYMVWMNHYNSNVLGQALGDFNTDGHVDGVDYVIWLANYGN